MSEKLRRALLRMRSGDLPGSTGQERPGIQYAANWLASELRNELLPAPVDRVGGEPTKADIEAMTDAELNAFLESRGLDVRVVDRVGGEAGMGERARAVTIATWTLDRPNADPDDDLAILSRQFLRCIDRPVDRVGGEGLDVDRLTRAIERTPGFGRDRDYAERLAREYAALVNDETPGRHRMSDTPRTEAALQRIIEEARSSTLYCNWCGCRPDQDHRGDCPAAIAMDALEAEAASPSTDTSTVLREAATALDRFLEYDLNTWFTDDTSQTVAFSAADQRRLDELHDALRSTLSVTPQDMTK